MGEKSIKFRVWAIGAPFIGEEKLTIKSNLRKTGPGLIVSQESLSYLNDHQVEAALPKGLNDCSAAQTELDQVVEVSINQAKEI